MIKIALTCARDDDKFYMHDRYTNTLLNCAAAAGIADVIPITLPYVTDEGIIRTYAEMFDGYIFTGGADIDPAQYGAEMLPVCGRIDTRRDAFEIALAREVIRAEKPAFGICRGIQTMNVALGGTIWQDIHSQCCREDVPHCVNDENGLPCHRVHISGCLRELCGQDVIMTNSYHHQAVKEPGQGLHVVGTSDEGVVEAVVHESLPFYRAVQWHPEKNPDWVTQKLFEAFLEAVRKSMKTP